MSKLTVRIVNGKQTGPARPHPQFKGQEVAPFHLELACGRELDIEARSVDLGPTDDNRKRPPRLSWPCPAECQASCTYAGRSDRELAVYREPNLLEQVQDLAESEMDVEPGDGRTMVPFWIVVLSGAGIVAGLIALIWAAAN